MKFSNPDNMKNSILFSFFAAVLLLAGSDADAQVFTRRANNVVWRGLSVTGDRDANTIKIVSTFTNEGEFNKCIETYFLTIVDDRGNVYYPGKTGDAAWIFRPNSYSIAKLPVGQPVISTFYLENFSVAATRIVSMSMTIEHRFFDKESTPNGEPKSNVFIKDIPIVWN